MFQITVKDAKIKLNDLIQAAENGEDILIVTDEQETIMLVQVEKPKKKLREFGTAKGQFEISDDFDAPLEAFKDYTPADQPKQESRIFGTAKGRFTVSDDFNDYMQLT